jgi:hypothetical protein
MAKPLNDILKGVKSSKIVPGSTGNKPGVDYSPKAKDDQNFIAKHKIEKHEDRVGNDDDIYKGKTNYSLDNSSEVRHGYKNGEAEKVYEATSKQINDRLDSLVAAKRAEKAGDKKTQYQHLADYHSKYATHVKKPDDIKHHKSQAEKYRNAAKAFGEGLQCNMTNEGTYCPVHENASCKESLVNPLLGSKDDDESAEMAKTQLRALANKAMALAMYLTDDMIVEPWVQSKIAVAKDQVTAVHDYMVYGDKKEQTAPYDGGIDTSGAPRDTYPSFSADANTGRVV